MNDYQKKRWLESLNIISSRRYECVHKFYSEDEGWCKLSFGNIQDRLDYTDTVEFVRQTMENFLSYHTTKKNEK